MTPVMGSPARDAQAPRGRQAGLCVASIDGAVLTLGDRPVLNGATLSLLQGEIYILLGPNGSGKTSLVRALRGQLPLERGRIGVGVALEDPRQNRRVLRLIGHVPQSIAIFPRLTVRENLEVFSRFLNADSGPGTINRLLDVALLGSVANSIAATLSGGLQRRVNIAVALIGEPQLLLLDEPTVGIDLEARSAIHQVLSDLRDRGRTILMITHDFDQAERLGDRVGFMNAGRIILEGRPADVLRQTFGDKKQIEAVLTDGVDDGTDTELRSLGLEPVDGRLLWRGLTDERQGTSKILQILQSSRVPLREIRIREPGLDVLFRQVTGYSTP
jgi:ABC-2 type transport system ATP-binding protein